jgi:hypothetical protein
MSNNAKKRRAAAAHNNDYVAPRGLVERLCDWVVAKSAAWKDASVKRNGMRNSGFSHADQARQTRSRIHNKRT